jgi:hypothetical protein
MIPRMTSENQTVFKTVDTATGNFTILRNEVVSDSNLSWGARGVLHYLLSKPPDWETRKSDIVAQSPEGETAIRKYLGELRDWGFLRYARGAQENGRHMWMTTVHDEALPGDPDERRRKPTFSAEEQEWFSACGFSTCRTSTCRLSTRRTSTRRYPTRLVSTEGVSTESLSTEEPNTEEQTAVSPSEISDPAPPGQIPMFESREPKNETEDEIDYSSGFDEAYALYPRKIGKKAALKSWIARVKQGADPEKLKLAAANYARECKSNKTETKFIKHPSTFFGPNDFWEDYLKISIPIDRRHDIVQHDDSDESESGEVSLDDILGPQNEDDDNE